MIEPLERNDGSDGCGSNGSPRFMSHHFFIFLPQNIAQISCAAERRAKIIGSGTQMCFIC